MNTWRRSLCEGLVMRADVCYESLEALSIPTVLEGKVIPAVVRLDTRCW